MAIVGNGDIAEVLRPIDRDDIVFFASGVSNSKCTDKKQFDRELRLLKKQPKNQKLVYFSSLSIYFKDTPYTKHKRNMEKQVKKLFKSYCIVRLGNINWGTNPNTIINYFKACIRQNKQPVIKQEYKFVINKDEFLYWINKIPKFNTEMNITGRKMIVTEIWNGIALNNPWFR